MEAKYNLIEQDKKLGSYGIDLDGAIKTFVFYHILATNELEFQTLYHYGLNNALVRFFIEKLNIKPNISTWCSPLLDFSPGILVFNKLNMSDHPIDPAHVIFYLGNIKDYQSTCVINDEIINEILIFNIFVS